MKKQIVSLLILSTTVLNVSTPLNGMIRTSLKVIPALARIAQTKRSVSFQSRFMDFGDNEKEPSLKSLHDKVLEHQLDLKKIQKINIRAIMFTIPWSIAGTIAIAAAHYAGPHILEYAAIAGTLGGQLAFLTLGGLRDYRYRKIEKKSEEAIETMNYLLFPDMSVTAEEILKMNYKKKKDYSTVMLSSILKLNNHNSN